MPPRESLEILGQSGATLAIHLSVRNLAYVETALTPHYGADCPAIGVFNGEAVQHRTGGRDRHAHNLLAVVRRIALHPEVTAQDGGVIGPLAVDQELLIAGKAAIQGHVGLQGKERTAVARG